VDLVVQPALASPAFSGLTASPSIIYGTPGVTLGGKLSATGPVYPNSGENISVTINGNTQTTTINDATGDFSINYNSSALPASGTPFSIAYAYSGDAGLTTAGNSTTTLTVNGRPVALTGTRAYDGTTAAAAGILTVTNAVGSDVVTVATGSGILTSGNVGSETISSVGTLALGGAAAGNYTLAGAGGLVTITTPPFTIMSGSVDVSGTNFIITWQSAPGASYHVISSSNIATALSNWVTVAGPITATDTNTSVTNAMTPPMSVFEVVSP
jgi:hypothetical protein